MGLPYTGVNSSCNNIELVWFSNDNYFIINYSYVLNPYLREYICSALWIEYHSLYIHYQSIWAVVVLLRMSVSFLHMKMFCLCPNNIYHISVYHGGLNGRYIVYRKYNSRVIIKYNIQSKWLSISKINICA